MAEIELDPLFREGLWMDDASYIPLAPKHAFSKILDGDGNWVGLLEWHECTDRVSAGGVNFDTPEGHAARPGEPPSHFWQVESWDPLTISPSIRCLVCDNHGFIRQGRWESC